MAFAVHDEAGLSRVEVDGIVYRVSFRGFGAPMAVLLDGGGEVTLSPWTCADHLRALAAHVTAEGGALALDPDGFAGDVLAKSGIRGAAAEEIKPLALLWAAGGAGASGPAEEPTRAAPEGWIDLGGGRARLRAWTSAERLRALRDTTVASDAGGAIDLIGYLERMIAASVAEVEPRGYDVRGCDAAATAALLDAVLAINVPDPREDIFDDSPAARELAAATLRLCRALGWTPSQVLSTPAPEVDRLLRLLDRVEGPSAGAPPPGTIARTPVAPSPSFAGHSAWVGQPDAIVIRIEDDG
jgi:hypothetical protein